MLITKQVEQKHKLATNATFTMTWKFAAWRSFEPKSVADRKHLLAVFYKKHELTPFCKASNPWKLIKASINCGQVLWSDRRPSNANTLKSAAKNDLELPRCQLQACLRQRQYAESIWMLTLMPAIAHPFICQEDGL